MPPGDYERFRQRLEEQLRADMELLYEGYRAKLRAYEMVARLRGELDVEPWPPLELARSLPPASGPAQLTPAPETPAAPPAPPARRSRAKSYELFDAITAGFADLPEAPQRPGHVPQRPGTRSKRPVEHIMQVPRRLKGVIAMREMKQSVIVLAVVLLTLATALPALAQTTSCDQGRLRAIAEQNLGFCIQPYLQGGNYEVTFDVTCACAQGGSVDIFARPRCNPNEFCPDFIVDVGHAEIDCNGNLITAICTSPQG